MAASSVHTDISASNFYSNNFAEPVFFCWKFGGTGSRLDTGTMSLEKGDQSQDPHDASTIQLSCHGQANALCFRIVFRWEKRNFKHLPPPRPLHDYCQSSQISQMHTKQSLGIPVCFQHNLCLVIPVHVLHSPKQNLKLFVSNFVIGCSQLSQNFQLTSGLNFKVSEEGGKVHNSKVIKPTKTY